MKKLSERISEARDELDTYGISPSVEELLDWLLEVRSMEEKESD